VGLVEGWRLAGASSYASPAEACWHGESVGRKVERESALPVPSHLSEWTFLAIWNYLEAAVNLGLNLSYIEFRSSIHIWGFHAHSWPRCVKTRSDTQSSNHGLETF